MLFLLFNTSDYKKIPDFFPKVSEIKSSTAQLFLNGIQEL